MKPEKTLERILGGSRNLAFDDVVSLIEAYGFRLDRVRGSHQIYRREGTPELINLQNVRGQAKPYQVRQIMKLIEKYNLEIGRKE